MVGRGAWRVIGVLALGAIVALVPALPAAAQTSLEVQAGVDGLANAGGHVVVNATIRADRLVRGELRATSAPEGALVVRQPVEVPGGSVKVVPLVVPLSSWAPGDITVTLDADGVRQSATATVETPPDVELVGVLPRLAEAAAPLPSASTLAVDAGSARLAPLVPEVLAMGPAALDGYDIVAGLTSDLDDLGPAERASLETWLHRGGRLLLDDDAEALALPPEWRPGPAGYAWAAGGEVRRTQGAATRGEWSTILEPSRVARRDAELLNVAQFEQSEPSSSSLTRVAGLSRPGLGWVLVVLGVYIVVVGPLLWLVLRRTHHQTLAWVLVPALALGTAALVILGGGGLRTDARPVAGVIAESGPGADGFANVLLLSRDGGEVGAVLPEGWALASADDFSSVVIEQEAGAGPTTVSATLDPGQAAMARAEGPLDAQEGLEVTATSAADGQASGTVRNTLDVPLQSVAVFAGNAAVNVGDLQAGEERAWDLTGASGLTVAGLHEQAWPGLAFGGGTEDGPPVELGTWGEFAAERRTGVRQPGLARAVGWTDDANLPVETLDGSPLRQRVGVTGVAPIRPDGRLTDLTVRRTLVRGPARAVARFLLPPDVALAPGPLELVVPPWVTRAEVWLGSAGWVAVAPTAPGGAVALAPEAVRNGAIHVRFEVAPGVVGAGGAGGPSDLVVRAAGGSS